ncbi:cilia- and flagella-associated protein 100 isoform X2 [Rhinatrema bivittatum]|uniref:cilia- and flagella-associated protein 100 isoform X2 n=1 Tax=Rhinatrema bivittatum TaxID=194408 RepID=UPI001126FBBB|nr:cilia- and flagella-associated protein 100 isoform X2 [Rhinatrema bivittatum]
MSSETVRASTESFETPEITGSGVISNNVADSGQELDSNPFTMPPDMDFFLFREQEKEKRQAELERQKHLKIHEKVSLKDQMKTKPGGIRKELQAEDIQEEKVADQERDISASPTWRLKVTKNRVAAKETLLQYTKRKRDMFLLQYALSVKRDEMQSMETMTASEEKKLEKAEGFLEEDAAMFDEFLKENDKCCVEAIKMADKETKLKMEKITEIKRLAIQMMNIKSEIIRHEDIMKEYVKYREFLYKLSPIEWQEKYKVKMKDVKSSQSSAKAKSQADMRLSKSSMKSADSRASSQHVHRFDSISTRRSSSKITVGKKLSSDTSQQLLIRTLSARQSFHEEEEDPVLFFTDPQQLLKILTDLEEQNLSLIQNSQGTEEALDDIRRAFSITQAKMKKETDLLSDIINRMKKAIAIEEEKAGELQLQSQVFSFEQHSEEDQENMMDALHKKVKQVYHSCLGDDQANLSTLQMLIYIENQMEDLLDKIELMPSEVLEVAEKFKDKERRLRLKEEKLKQRTLHQKERLLRAMERAQADPKKTSGRKLVCRSEPPPSKPREEKKVQEHVEKEKEETTYFFN